MRRLLQVYATFNNLIDRFTEILGLLILLAIFLLTFALGIFRAWAVSLSWLLEWVPVAFACLVFILLGYATRRDAHIRMGIFLERLVGERRAFVISRSVENLIGLGLGIYFTWVTFLWTRSSYLMGDRQWSAGGFWYPLWAIKMVATIGIGLLTLFYLERFIRRLIPKVSANREPAEMPHSLEKQG